MRGQRQHSFTMACILLLVVSAAHGADNSTDTLKNTLDRLDIKRDICVMLGLPPKAHRESVADFVLERDLTVFFQSPDTKETAGMRKAAEQRGLLGTRIFVEEGDWQSVHLASNLAGLVLVAPQATDHVSQKELLRVVHPGGTIITDVKEVTKPRTRGVDSWSHPHHGPDNNPQSTDELARAPYLTQFLSDPKFCPMPEVSVAAGGRVFRAFGHIAHKANQNAMLNTLICTNAYNGMILWQRKLKEGFMIHRNTMIATPHTLYMADADACQLIDAATGKVRNQIVIPENVADGKVWKWMAMEGGILYALIGGPETSIQTQPSKKPGLGHWPWGMWQGHEYQDPGKSFGFGRTFVAIDPETRKILWTHSTKDYLDSRGVCMKNGRIYCYSPETYLACFDTEEQEMVWKTSSPDLLKAIGPNGRAQHYVTGYATTAYMKCNDDYILFAGPQRGQLVVASAEDGGLLWQKPEGNLQLVFLSAPGPGVKF
ncbi:MAG: PQQ-like beta-propeller repeat protein [Planctomycetes bacterium]|nr:PQQ-like beta-propeller repeat protein [Planctomycetota bacterium]